MNNNTKSDPIDTAISILAEQTDVLVESRVKTAPFDKTYNGVITAIKFNNDTEISSADYNKYTVKFNLLEKDFIIDDGKIHSVGEKVIVHLPNNVLMDRYVECINQANLTDIAIDNLDSIVFKYDTLNRKYEFETSPQTIIINGQSYTVDMISKITKPNGKEIIVNYE